ncbi:MAG: hypothetical protein QXW97_02550 [Candidatus Pacearchaeota archaeon]
MPGTPKEKIVGILLIIIGIFPLLMMIESFKDSISKYNFLDYFIPGNPAFAYQLIIIILGLLLIFSSKPRRIY